MQLLLTSCLANPTVHIPIQSLSYNLVIFCIVSLGEPTTLIIVVSQAFPSVLARKYRTGTASHGASGEQIPSGHGYLQPGN